MTFGVQCGATGTINALGDAAARPLVWTCPVSDGANVIYAGQYTVTGASKAFVEAKKYSLNVTVPRGLASGSGISSVSIRHRSRREVNPFATYAPYMHTRNASHEPVRE